MTEVTKQPKRRWWRFSLRTLLIVLTIFCVWLGWYLYRVEQQRKAVEWVLENGGTVYYDYQFDTSNGALKNSHPPVLKWLHDMLGVDYFSTVASVGITQVEDVTPLAGLTSLQNLQLRNTQVSDTGPLTTLKNLLTLDLSNTPINDVTPLATLKNLRSLDLSDTQVSDVTPLAGLTRLRQLRLHNTQVNDLTPLVNLNLTLLGIRHTKVSDEEIEKIQLALPNCKIMRKD